MKTKNPLIDDVSSITTIPKNQLSELLNKFLLIACHDIKENMDSGECETDIDFYFGTVKIYIENESIMYKFIPSKKFESMVTKTVTTGESPLIEEVENTLRDRLQSTYKDLF